MPEANQDQNPTPAEPGAPAQAAATNPPAPDGRRLNAPGDSRTSVIPDGRMQAEIQKALAAQQAQFQNQLKEATGFESLQAFQEAQLKEQGKLKDLLDAKTAALDEVTEKFQQTQINNALLAAASDAVDPSVVVALLAGKTNVDGNGNVLVDGMTPDEAVKTLLRDKPFLAKASGNQGSGAPQNSDGGKTLSRAAFDALAPAEKQQFVRDGGTITD